MNEVEETKQQNMISNLPLIFANGYPTSLGKITEAQLENFIPFMVQCSLGHINLQGKVDYNEPEWWPEDVPFAIPISKPKKFIGNWLNKMKEIVLICYKFHKSIFLLRFCTDLASYEHASLRFINNYNSTTSLYDRRSNKLLVTFRNENMSYDQQQRGRKCLLQQKSKSQSDLGTQQHMVEPAPFDIYLCDNCDAELYSHEAIMEHEKTCFLDDDVIICDTPTPEKEDMHLNIASTSTENQKLREAFLLNFHLQSREGHTCKNFSVPNSVDSTKEVKEEFIIMDKLKRLPRRNRGVHSLSRCPTIPLSSPAGQLLIKSSKTAMTEEYLLERLDRTERFCHAPILSKGVNRPKFLDKKFGLNHVQCTFKKPLENTLHIYKFPRRNFYHRERLECSMSPTSFLMKRCRPVRVRLRKLSESEIRQKIQANINSKLNIRLTRDNSQGSNWKISPMHIVLDTIDLCSSDEETDCESADISRTQINHFLKKLPPEVTLTRISKSTLDRNLEELRKQNKFEGNFLLSQQVSNLHQQPLQPSVFLFSNYTTNPLSIHSCGNSNSDITCNLNNYQNQENLDNSIKKSSSDDWLPNSINNNINNHNRHTERNSKVMQIMQFNSPSRTISIDLTL